MITAPTRVFDGDGIALKDVLPTNESDDATTLTGGISHCVE